MGHFDRDFAVCFSKLFEYLTLDRFLDTKSLLELRGKNME